MSDRTHKMNAHLERIAREILDIETSKPGTANSLDFSEQPVWTLRRALEAAYEAGRAARQDQADVFVPTELPAQRRAAKILGSK
jgi:hypothetical protein